MGKGGECGNSTGNDKLICQLMSFNATESN